jgi:hypothetical protein
MEGSFGETPTVATPRWAEKRIENDLRPRSATNGGDFAPFADGIAGT